MNYRLRLIEPGGKEVASFESSTLPVKGEIIALRPPESTRQRTFVVTEVQRNILVDRGMWIEADYVHVLVEDHTP